MNRLMDEVARRRDGLQSTMLDWAQANFREYPWRENRTPYSVLVAEVLLKRTTATAVSKVYEKFLDLYPTLKALSEAERGELEDLLSAIGYHKLRAVALIEMAKFVIKNHDGQLPQSKAELLKVPHIGSYTAGAILSLGYGIPSAMVDSNVQRILRRFFSRYVGEKPALRIIQRIADRIVPGDNHELFNLGLLDLGALVCRYDRPRCNKCPLKIMCDTPKDLKQIS